MAQNDEYLLQNVLEYTPVCSGNSIRHGISVKERIGSFNSQILML